MAAIRTYLLFLFLILFCTSVSGQNYHLVGGYGFTRLQVDSLELESQGHPFLGLLLNVPVRQRLSLDLGLKYAKRGADYGFFKYEYRNHYLDLTGLIKLEVGSGLFFRAGYEYSYLLASRLRVYDNPVDRNYYYLQTKGFQNQASLLGGIGIRLNKGVELQAIFKVPLTSVQFYNYEIGLVVNIDRLKPPRHLKTFTSLENAMKDPMAVKKLVLQREQLKSIPGEVFSFINLEVLVLDGNKISELPSEIGRLKNLKRLSLAFNDLSELPDEIGQLTLLEELNLDHNNLKKIPDGIGQLKNLKFLYIGKNNLVDVNKELANCSSLVELDLAQSGVMLLIPACIGDLPNLEKLFVDKTVQFHYAFRPLNPRMEIIFK